MRHATAVFAVSAALCRFAAFPAAAAVPPGEGPAAGKDGAPPEAVATGDRVNVRAAADGESQTLGQLGYGERVVLAGSAGDPWVKIRLPERFNVWIYSELVKTDESGRSVVGVNRAQLRAGPGLNHASVGLAERGTPLEPLGRSGDWTKLSPKRLPAWGFVTNAYLKSAAPPPPPAPPPRAERPVLARAADAQPAERLPEPAKAPVAAAAPPEVPSGPAAPPPVLAEEVRAAPPAAAPGAGRDVATAAPSAKPRRTLLSTERPVPVGPAGIPSSRLRNGVPQARSGSYAGTLARAPAFGAHPTRWRLVRFAAGTSGPETVCYVHGNDAQLSGLANRSLTVSGAVYFFRSTSLPTIFAQDIVLDR